jgi:very-short-patch-repair endonuclease
MADKPTLITRARAMRKGQSRAESAVWEIVRANRLGVKFRRQHPVEDYIADFACIEARLIVEVDGLSHDIAGQRDYDEERTRVLAVAGWRVLRVRDSDVLGDVGSVARSISAALNPLPREGERAG